MTAAPAALVLVRAPAAGGAALGHDSAARTALRAVLVRRAAAWAAATAPGAAWVAVEPAGGLQPIAALLPRGTACFSPAGDTPAQRLVAAVARVGHGPLLIAEADCPALGPAHAAAALDDLAAGCDLVLGGSVDGGWYLAGLREPRPALLALLPEGGPAGREGGIGVLVGRAAALGATVGLLRQERRLRTPDDAAAWLADPLAPADVRAALAGGG